MEGVGEKNDDDMMVRQKFKRVDVPAFDGDQHVTGFSEQRDTLIFTT